MYNVVIVKTALNVWAVWDHGLLSDITADDIDLQDY